MYTHMQLIPAPSIRLFRLTYIALEKQAFIRDCTHNFKHPWDKSERHTQEMVWMDFLTNAEQPSTEIGSHSVKLNEFRSDVLTAKMAWEFQRNEILCLTHTWFAQSLNAYRSVPRSFVMSSLIHITST